MCSAAVARLASRARAVFVKRWFVWPKPALIIPAFSVVRCPTVAEKRLNAAVAPTENTAVLAQITVNVCRLPAFPKTVVREPACNVARFRMVAVERSTAAAARGTRFVEPARRVESASLRQRVCPKIHAWERRLAVARCRTAAAESSNVADVRPEIRARMARVSRLLACPKRLRIIRRFSAAWCRTAAEKRLQSVAAAPENTVARVQTRVNA